MLKQISLSDTVPISESLTIKDSRLWTIDAIKDELFVQICEHGETVDDPASSVGKVTGIATEKANKYYIEAGLYANRVAVWKFDRKDKSKWPIFKGNFNDFDDTLQWHLKQSKESLNEIMTDAIFALIKARHKLAFYKYIQPNRKYFRWDF